MRHLQVRDYQVRPSLPRSRQRLGAIPRLDHLRTRRTQFRHHHQTDMRLVIGDENQRATLELLRLGNAHASLLIYVPARRSSSAHAHPDTAGSAPVSSIRGNTFSTARCRRPLRARELAHTAPHNRTHRHALTPRNVRAARNDPHSCRFRHSHSRTHHPPTQRPNITSASNLGPDRSPGHLPEHPPGPHPASPERATPAHPRAS